MTVELSNATEVAKVIGDGNVHVHWAPGDGTRYRVVLVNTVDFGVFDALDRNHDFTALMVMVGSNLAALVLTRPHHGDNEWTAERFLNQFGERYAGWWAGVRPLLAALDWTAEACSSLDYDPGDAARIGELLEKRVG